MDVGAAVVGIVAICGCLSIRHNFNMIAWHAVGNKIVCNVVCPLLTQFLVVAFIA